LDVVWVLQRGWGRELERDGGMSKGAERREIKVGRDLIEKTSSIPLPILHLQSLNSMAFLRKFPAGEGEPQI
jgi:hypothetical protein